MQPEPAEHWTEKNEPSEGWTKGIGTCQELNGEERTLRELNERNRNLPSGGRKQLTHLRRPRCRASSRWAWTPVGSRAASSRRNPTTTACRKASSRAWSGKKPTRPTSRVTARRTAWPPAGQYRGRRCAAPAGISSAAPGSCTSRVPWEWNKNSAYWG